ncbi:MAG: helix-turn-helix domain-containing protein, partial [Planctomycetota bacterium]|nr:helix-turn-helix domain-containing protein [Planctomycetota bacterium]
MQEIEYISVKKAASLLGVSVSSVKRWVDAGTLPAVKTCGGHRRLRMDDVMAMQSAAAVTEPEVSGQEAGL